MASVTPISPPFLPISYLCAGVSFGNRVFHVFQHLAWLFQCYRPSYKLVASYSSVVIKARQVDC